MTVASSPAARRTRAVESFGTAALAIGNVKPGMAVFIVTRGQFSMLDAVEHIVDACAPCDISIWTWTIAGYEADALARLLASGKVTSGRLIVDVRSHHVRASRLDILRVWEAHFGAGSVKHVVNHAKMVTLEGRGMRVLLRGSPNLNKNPRFEQLDVTEGGPDFDLVRAMEAEIPLMGEATTQQEATVACGMTDAFPVAAMPAFAGIKAWRP